MKALTSLLSSLTKFEYEVKFVIVGTEAETVLSRTQTSNIEECDVNLEADVLFG